MKTEQINKIMSLLKKKDVDVVSFQFVDIPGNLKSVAVPTKSEVNKKDFEDYLENGVGFDGSSVEGFVRIAESDLVLMPDLSTFRIFPWKVDNIVEARIICDVFRPGGQPFEGDPIHVLKETIKRLEKKIGKGTTFNLGPEIEFFIFQTTDGMTVMPLKTDVYGYFDYAPLDKATISVNRAIFYLQDLGINVEKVHHECARGQYEINFRYDSAFNTAVNFITYKLAVKTAVSENGLFASFMPKPIFGVPGSGSHTHQSIFNKEGKNIFFDSEDDYHLSETARHFLAGQLKHARGIAAVTNPTVNSYKRLTPGYEAPVYICWARKNRSALVRVPEYFPGREKATRLEARWPDPSMNPFLAFSVMLEAGLDGIENKLELANAVEEDVYHFDDAKLKKFYIETLPGTLGEAMDLLKQSEIVRRALGDYIVKKLLEAERAQWEPYRIQVHQWELDRYLAH